MKPVLSSIGTAILLGLLSYAIDRPLAVYDYVVILFATGVVVWTYEQYNPRPQL